jgi:uncharacterized membrane protein HdeD (DUF308 family)
MAGKLRRSRPPLNDKRAEDNTGWLLLQGMIDVLCGTVGVSVSIFAMPTTIVLFGWLLIAVATLFAAFGFHQKSWRNFVHDLAFGAAYGIAGSALAYNPTATAIWLTLLIAIFLLVAGVCHGILSLTGRLECWSWMLIHGLRHRQLRHHDLHSIAAVEISDEWANWRDRDDSLRLVSDDSET